MRRLLEWLAMAIMIAILAWFVFSVIEIDFKNCNPDPVYSDYNLFIVLENLSKQ